jgi:formylglycine-generating enzyme required for sulfatase activity
VQQVRLDPYFLSKFEMTQGQWLRASGVMAARFRPDPYYDAQVTAERLPAAPTLLHPVETVNWNECTHVLQHFDLVLPTEAQWEFAARAGSSSGWYFWRGADDWAVFGKHANVADEFAKQWRIKRDETLDAVADAVALHIDDGYLMTAPVGSLLANGFGLHDVHGNVWEWCGDPYDDGNYADGLRDGDGRCKTGQEWDAVVRGGSFQSRVPHTRVSFRETNPRDSRWTTHGVRPARRYDANPGESR